MYYCISNLSCTLHHLHHQRWWLSRCTKDKPTLGEVINMIGMGPAQCLWLITIVRWVVSALRKKLTLAMEKWTRIEDVVPNENGDIPLLIAMLVYQRVGACCWRYFRKLDGTPAFWAILYLIFFWGVSFIKTPRILVVASCWMHVKLKPKSQVFFSCVYASFKCHGSS